MKVALITGITGQDRSHLAECKHAQMFMRFQNKSRLADCEGITRFLSTKDAKKGIQL